MNRVKAALRATGSLLEATFVSWRADNASQQAAALAFYTLFSLAPVLIIGIAIAGAVFGEQAARGEIFEQIRGIVGDTSAEAIEALIESANRPFSSEAATIIGIAAMLIGATAAFAQLKTGLNTVWHVKQKPGRGVVGELQNRLLSFVIVLGIGALLLLSLMVSISFSALTKMLGGLLPAIPYIGRFWSFMGTFAITTLLFAMLFKILPDAKVAWSHVWLGSIFTALLFNLGKVLIGLYLGRKSVTSAYGAAGSLIVVFFWVYYSAQILFFGAEFIRVYSEQYGAPIVPGRSGVWSN